LTSTSSDSSPACSLVFMFQWSGRPFNGGPSMRHPRRRLWQPSQAQLATLGLKLATLERRFGNLLATLGSIWQPCGRALNTPGILGDIQLIFSL
jgi:hypothetical protein